MIWLIYSQISAISESFTNLLAKKRMKEFDSTVVIWGWVVSSLILLGGLVVATGIPDLKPLFFTALFVRILFDTFALLTYAKALQLGDISFIAPLFNFSAIITLSISYVINSELPSILGFIGILLVVFGAYVLNFESKKNGLLHPFKNMMRNKAAAYMLVSTVLYGIVFSVSKIGIQNSNLFFFTFASALGMSLTIFFIAYFKNRSDLFKIMKPRNFVKMIPIGFVDAIKILALMATINTTFVSYADAANSTSTLYTVFFGAFFLKEKIKGRVIPAIIMFIGLILLAVS
ncbi:EamA family transporter [Candidatus Woesebacteria bacterium]|nr:EamA family transporter [Candidatus Woesebacteria bacterium]